MGLTEAAKALSKDEVDDFRKAFQALDKDGDGELTTLELGELMNSLGLNATEEELKDIINEVDIDNTGTVDFEEFLNMMAIKATKTDEEEELRRAFSVFDRDGSGTISASEIHHVMKSLGDNMSDEEIDDIIKMIDKDGDGTIDYKEFAAFLQAN